MSVEDHEAVDVLCPHGPEHHEPPAVAFVSGEGLFDDAKGVLYAESKPGTQWIEADEDAFIEVGQ